MAETFIPLFSSTVRSSLWSLSGDCLKVFLTFALEAGPDGMVVASIDGMRRIMGMSMADVQRHIATLEGPDPHSKDAYRGGTGARLERVANGWRVINLQWYREEARRQAELFRKRKWWNDKGSDARRDARHTETERETERETETETEKTHREIPPTPQGTIAPGVFNAPSYAVNPNKGRIVPESWKPTEKHIARCQELRIDLPLLVRTFRAIEFTRDYSDWDRRFDLFIEEHRVRRETDPKRTAKATPKRFDPRSA